MTWMARLESQANQDEIQTLRVGDSGRILPSSTVSLSSPPSHPSVRLRAIALLYRLALPLWHRGSQLPPSTPEKLKLPHYPRYPCDASESDRKSTRLNSSHLGISYAVF